MKEFKGTKGEWDCYLGNTSFKITDQQRDVLNIEEVGDIDEAQANAQLIATAPELLETCQYMLNQLKGDSEISEGEGYRCVTKLENVINKALEKKTI